MKHLVGTEEIQKHVEDLRELVGKSGVSSAERTAGARLPSGASRSVPTPAQRAVQAFWAMHVEALNWSGMSVREYATAPLLSPWSLRKRRDRLDYEDGEIE